MFQGVSATVLAISFKELPQPWLVHLPGVLDHDRRRDGGCWPISSIVVLSIVAGVWLVVIGTTKIVWALSVRSTTKKVERGVELAQERRRRLTHQSAC